MSADLSQRPYKCRKSFSNEQHSLYCHPFSSCRCPEAGLHFVKNLDLVGHDLVELLFGTIGGGVLADAQAPGDIDRCAFFDLVQILDVPSTPCDDIVPHALVRCASLSGLVEEIRNHGEVDDLAAVVLVGADSADNALELDSVDVFHKS